MGESGSLELLVVISATSRDIREMRAKGGERLLVSYVSAPL